MKPLSLTELEKVKALFDEIGIAYTEKESFYTIELELDECSKTSFIYSASTDFIFDKKTGNLKSVVVSGD